MILLAWVAFPSAPALAQGFEMFPSVSASTGEKPQSKLFYHDGSYWAVLRGPDGVAFYELVAGTWQRGQFANAVLQSSGNADVRWNGTELFVLVYGSTPRVYEYSYAAATRSWVLASGFPVVVPNPSGSETMVLEQDSSGRLWTTAEGGGDVNVYYTTSADHTSWSTSPIVLRSGVNADDITSIVAFGGDKVGVFWSDQNRDEFGFSVHQDGDPPTTWSPMELVDTGPGHADDHVNLAFDSQGRVYAITKDDQDRMRVHRRAVNGTWTTKTDVTGGIGTRGIIMVAEQDAKVYILYTRWGVSPERIEYRVADIDALAFGGETIFITSSTDVNNVTGMKQLLPQGSLIAAAENGSVALWNGFGSPPAGGPQPPGPPQSLTAALMSSPTRVELTWVAPPNTTVSGYNLYRQVDGGAFQLLNESPLPTPSFTDSSPPEGDLCYRATALGTTGLEGGPSNVACVDTRPVPDGVIESPIMAATDDAEEGSNGSVNLTSSDLELMTDGTPQLVVGLRFAGLAIPPGASVTRAYLQFQADESQSEATTLTIHGQAVDDAPTFTSASGSLTARLAAATQAAVTWAGLAPWTVGQAGPDQRTPELGPVLQEIVGRPGWQSGHALALLITGSGHRTAEAYDGGGPAALLHVEYTTGQAANLAPTVNAGPDQTITLPSAASLDGTVSDDGLPAPPTLVTTWSQVGGPAAVTLADDQATDTQVSFAAAGSYLLELRASDGELDARDTVAIVVEEAPPEPFTIETRIAAGSDDAEQSSSGTVDLSSSDLEMMMDGGPQDVVGLRFTGLAIPPGSTVARAYVQFQSSDAQSGATTLTILGEAVDDAPVFTNEGGSLTARLAATTQAAATWTDLAPWAPGEAGADQRTPELGPVLQEIIGRPGWQSGHAVALLITGSGHRTAESFDGNASAAALLHVEFNPPTLDAGPLPAAPRLEAGVAPNPMSRGGRFHFVMPEAGQARITLFDVQGRRVRELLDLTNLGAGRHDVDLDGRDEAGAPLRTGVYLYRLETTVGALSGRFLIAR